MYSYLRWLLVFAVLLVLILVILKFDLIRTFRKVLFFTLIGSLVFALPWDLIAIKEKIWYFEKPHILGIYFLTLPIEEWIFIVFETLLFAIITIIIWEKLGREK